MSHNQLIPVFAGHIAGAATQLCDARTLHVFLQVKRDFTDWVKGRIRKFKFVAGEDFIAVANLSSPNLGSANLSSKARAQKLTDYHLTLDMAKELSMVENNEQGRAARRYFISCEKQALAQQPARPYNPAIDYERISPAQAQQLKELVERIVAAAVQGHAETWSRLHKKFKVNSYLQLPASRCDEARAYLHAKLPASSASAPAAPAGKMLVDQRKLATIWHDLGQLRERINALGILEADLPPSWWQAHAISAG